MEQVILTHDDMKAVNTEENPAAVAPQKVEPTQPVDGKLTMTLPKHTWTAVQYAF